MGIHRGVGRRIALGALAALAIIVTSISSSAPVHADSASAGGSVGTSPTYNRLNPGTCATSGVTVGYAALQFTTVGQSATNLTITVSASGFTPVLTLYEGSFLPGSPVANCYVQAQGGSGSSATINTAYGGLPDPFTEHLWTVVVAATNPGETGTFSVTFDSSGTGVVVGSGGGGDTTPPTVSAPSDQTAEATSAAGANVTYPAATATDAVDGAITPICNPASGSPFPFGPTTVTCSATDTAGNTGTGTFVVTVQDTTNPTLTAPSDQTVEATSAAGATVTYPAPTANDTADPTLTVLCSPPSGGVFAIGTTTVNCIATDDAGNTATDTFIVTVQDTTDPTLTAPSDQTVEATSSTGATVDYPAPTVDDTADSNPTVLCSPPSGGVFAIGTTTVNCTATDDAGNTATDSFTVTVQDTTGPVLELTDQQFTATAPSGAPVDYIASATDTVDGVVTPSCTPASGTTFALGDTTVSCTATDDAGNLSSGDFVVSVLDEGVPLLQLPPDETVEATGPDGAVVDFEVTATDDVDASPDVSCMPASGSTFPLGATDVSCTATDAEANESTGGFSITVVDTTGPVLDLPGTIEVQATGPDGAVVTFEASANDAVSGSVPVTCTPPSGSLFPVGTTTVTCTASDGGAVPVGVFGQTRRITQVDPGNETIGTFDVVVQAPPVPTTSAAPATTAPGSTSTAPAAPTTTIAADLPETGAASGPTAGAAAAVVALGGLVMLAGSTLRLRRRS